MRKTAMSGHQSAAPLSVDWLTPPEWIAVLGPFDLDPCCPAIMPWRTAARMIQVPADGLTTTWHGRVWCNPPFDRRVGAWLKKLRAHGDGIGLCAARTETRWFYEHVWPADAICFVKGRPHFYKPDGTRGRANSGAPICLVAYGERNIEALDKAGLGIVIRAPKHDN